MKFELNDGILPMGYPPYILWKCPTRTPRKPTPRQQLILDQMRPGAWYRSEPPQDRRDSCNALVVGGWLIEARIAKKGNDGELIEKTAEDLLLDIVLGRSTKAPLVMYRLVVAEV